MEYRGAYAAFANGAAPAAFIMALLPSDSLMHFWGHGGPGYVIADRVINAKRSYPGERGFFIEDLNLSGTRLVVWQACNTAVTSQAYGNLTAQTVIQGAKCAVGFKDEILFQQYPGAPNRQWAHFLWQALCQGGDWETGAVTGKPMTVRDALRYAVKWVKNLNDDNTFNYHTYVTAGTDVLRIVPAP